MITDQLDNMKFCYQLIITLTKFVLCKALFKIKTEEIPNFFASTKKKRACDGVYCPIKLFY